MVLSQTYFAPTRIVTGGDWQDNLAAAIDGRRWSLVTSNSWCQRNLPAQLSERLGPPVQVVGDVPPNPSENYILDRLEIEIGDVIVAIGGGSVMDAAKTLVTVDALGDDRHLLSDHLRAGTSLPADLEVAPLICVPTTSGTGSEVTRWATIWGEDKIKYSLTDPKLYPECAILAPELCLSMSKVVTISSGLDAVSHAMEAVWNRNHTVISDQLARTALATLRDNLGRSLVDANDIEARSQVQIAATIAGMAMGTTQTALCHSISYPFTSLFGLPHGLACSFTLSAVCRFNSETDAERLKPIAEGLSVTSINDLSDAIAEWFHELEIGRYLKDYVGLQHLESLEENLITRSRAANNIRAADGATAKELARQGIQMFLSR